MTEEIAKWITLRLEPKFNSCWGSWTRCLRTWWFNEENLLLLLFVFVPCLCLLAILATFLKNLRKLGPSHLWDRSVGQISRVFTRQHLICMMGCLLKVSPGIMGEAICKFQSFKTKKGINKVICHRICLPALHQVLKCWTQEVIIRDIKLTFSLIACKLHTVISTYWILWYWRELWNLTFIALFQEKKGPASSSL